VSLKISAFWDLLLSSTVKVLLLASCLAYCFAYSLSLKMEALYPYETASDFQRTSFLHIPEDITIHVCNASQLCAAACGKQFTLMTLCQAG
jgi:hypothetical protein